jgi:uncharacterized membrane protein YphA (DoxX/SURF4 family)
VARPLLASIFIYGGISALRDANGHAKAAEPFLNQTIGKLDNLLPDVVPRDHVTLVRMDAAVKVGAGLALASGKFPRLASVLLLGSLIPTTIATHPFWTIEDPAERRQEMTRFVTNASLGGGLLIAAADTGGKPSLGWRARRAAKKAAERAEAVLPPLTR